MAGPRPTGRLPRLEVTYHGFWSRETRAKRTFDQSRDKSRPGRSRETRHGWGGGEGVPGRDVMAGWADPSLMPRCEGRGARYAPARAPSLAAPQPRSALPGAP